MYVCMYVCKYVPRTEVTETTRSTTWLSSLNISALFSSVRMMVTTTMMMMFLVRTPGTDADRVLRTLRNDRFCEALVISAFRGRGRGGKAKNEEGSSYAWLLVQVFNSRSPRHDGWM